MLAEVDNTAIIISSVVGFFGTVFGGIVAILLARMDKKIEQVHIATNSMKDALVAETARSKMAEGEKKGRADQAAETKAAQASVAEGRAAEKAEREDLP